MLPYYEDAAQLLRFLVSRGLPLPNCQTHHQIIERIAICLDCYCDPSVYTHIEAAEQIIISLEWLGCGYAPIENRPKMLAIVGTMIAPRMDAARRKHQASR